MDVVNSWNLEWRGQVVLNWLNWNKWCGLKKIECS